jgi:quercetin dioxygenase-like cupin family protein
MVIFRFDPQVGRSIDRYNSSGFTISRIAHLPREAVINCAYLDSGGVIGYHRAAVSQLFLVIQGEGWVRGESSERYAIQAGQAAFWEKGEWHESGTDSGIAAIIVESEQIDPTKLMPPV